MTSQRRFKVVRFGGGKWHRGGRNDYPGAHHCPVGLAILLKRGSPLREEAWWVGPIPPSVACVPCFGDRLAHWECIDCGADQGLTMPEPYQRTCSCPGPKGLGSSVTWRNGDFA